MPLKSLWKKPFYNSVVPHDDWHSWDSSPWSHPWLTTKNLTLAKKFSENFLEIEKSNYYERIEEDFKYAFVGNLANNLYQRVVPLRKSGAYIDIFPHPHDSYIMSYPQWEEYYGVISGDTLIFDELVKQGNSFPDVEGITRIPPGNSLDSNDLSKAPEYSDIEKFKSFSQYFCFENTFRKLREYSSLWCTQSPYFGYLSEMPYVASQIGGDIWFECSRGDVLGKLQRISFQSARVFLVSNPWSYAFARRYGFNNMVYLPFILDENVYKPGDGNSRKKWIADSGGDFFILTTSRLDQSVKGTAIAIDGFVELSKIMPNARLVAILWGNDQEKIKDLIAQKGIANKVIWLPLSGKALLRDYLNSSDCFIDQFVVGYFGAAGLEAIASGLPVIGRYEIEQYAALCETGPPPVLQAKSSRDVYDHLYNLASNADYKKKCALKNRNWFLENHSSKRWSEEYMAVLYSTAKRLPADFNESPLSKQLSWREKIYHYRQLYNAPEFPSYDMK